MAKQNNKGGGGAVSLIFLLIFLVGLILLATPFVLLAGTLFYMYSYITIRSKMKGTYSDFWLTESEQSKFVEVFQIFYKADSQMEIAEKIGDEEGLARNVDGSFTLRGNRGKEVQGHIEYNKRIAEKYGPEASELSNLPQNRWLEFRKRYVKFYSFLFSMISWAITTAIFISNGFSNFYYGVNAMFEFPGELITKVFAGKDRYKYEIADTMLKWKILLISTMTCLIVYFLIPFILKSFAKKVSPIPPAVNFLNVTSY